MSATVTYEILVSDNELPIPGLLLCLRTVSGARADTALHWHFGTELTYVLDGSVTYTCSGIRQVLTAEDFIIVNSGMIHQAQNTDPGADNTTLTLILPDTWIRQILPSQKSFCFCAQTAAAQEKVSAALRQLIHSITSKAPYQELRLQRDLLALVYILFSETLLPAGSSHTDMPAIREIIDYINLHYSEPLTLSGISMQFGIQKNYFCRLFREASGSTFHRYLSRIRLDAALSLLADGQLSSAQCALQCGFSSEKVMIDWCHRIYSCSPKKYLTLIQK